jgi:hypothetical protein
MAWESRQGKRYYYRSRRVGQRIERDFLGNGSEAHLAAARIELRRWQRQARRAQQEAWAGAGQVLDQLSEGTDLLTRAALLAAGYHQHHHWKWRKRRDREE